MAVENAVETNPVAGIVGIAVLGGFIGGTAIGLKIYEKKLRKEKEAEIERESALPKALNEELVLEAKVLLQRQPSLTGVKELRAAISSYSISPTGRTEMALRAVMGKYAVPDQVKIAGGHLGVYHLG